MFKLKSAIVAAGLVFAGATATQALPFAPAEQSSPMIVKVAEGCGPGMVRGAFGRCRPMGGMMRGCPRGMHMTPRGCRRY